MRLALFVVAGTVFYIDMVRRLLRFPHSKVLDEDSTVVWNLETCREILISILCFRQCQSSGTTYKIRAVHLA